MIHGVSGQLVSLDYAEHVLAHAFATRLGEQTRAQASRAIARWWKRAGGMLGPASSLRALFDLGAAPLLALFGFSARSPRASSSAGLLTAEAVADGVIVSLLVTNWGESMDRLWGDLAREGLRLSADWALCFNGSALRLCDARHTHARAYLEFDLEHLADTADVQALCWGLLRADGLGSVTADVVRASASHGVAVAASLRDGVHDALATLLDGFACRARGRRRGGDEAAGLAGSLDEALTVVYRVLFLLFAESRSAVPVWHPVYRRSYTIDALRTLAERRGHARGLWEGLQALSRLAHAGCRAGTLTVTPFNGRLFAPSRAPLADTLRLDDARAARALVSLTTHTAQGRRDRISFRDLGVEQLGSIYESVLDYEPVVERRPFPAARRDGRSRPDGAGAEPPLRVRLVSRGDVRKSSGTFYTPQVITDYLVRQALEPLVHDAAAEDILRLRILDPAMGSGAFLVAACRYLASAYETAFVRERGIFACDVTEKDRAGFRRRVAQHCLYGVDINPMAVQVARLSMWLTTLAEERPLSFLDHRLVAGDSLVGASLEDIARQPPGGRPPRRVPGTFPLFDDEAAGAAFRAALPVRAQLEGRPDDTAEIVREKERLLASMSSPAAALARLKRAADLWCACWFWNDGRAQAPGVSEYEELASVLRGGTSTLPSRLVETRLAEVRRLAERHRFFHWTLEFPEVFFAPDGSASPRAGFDAIVGNPPWEMLRGDTGSVQVRAERRGGANQLVRFARRAGIYRASTEGHVNQYQLFVERSVRLLRAGGRLGLVLPWGLASDHGSAGLRRLLLERCAVEAIVGFENSDAIFPIHRGVRFLLLSAATGRSTDRVRCRFGEHDPGRLQSIEHGTMNPADAGRTISVTPPLLSRLSGPGLAFPYIRRPIELQLLERLVATVPALSDPRGFGARFGRELNRTDDRACFSAAGDITVVEGKHIDPFRVRLADCRHRVRSLADLPSRELAREAGRHRLAYRDVASATNRVTLIAAIIPPGAVTVHTLYCLRTRLALPDQRVLCALLNSFAANFLVRLWVTTHLGTTTVERLPVPRPIEGTSDWRRLGELAACLSAGPADPADAHAELQARACLLYGLDGEEIAMVLDSFPLVEPAIKAGVTAWTDRLAVRRRQV